jgi:hypothetical protein
MSEQTTAEKRVDELQAQLQAAREEIDLQNDWIRKAVEIAGVFQQGGELSKALSLGASTVHDGMRWLLTEREAAEQREAALREKLKALCQCVPDDGFQCVLCDVLAKEPTR